VDNVDGVALAPYTLATKLTVSATKLNVSETKSTATSCRIHVVVDLLLKPAKKSTLSAKVDFVGKSDTDLVANLLLSLTMKEF